MPFSFFQIIYVLFFILLVFTIIYVLYHQKEHKNYRKKAHLLEEQSRELRAAREEAERAKNDAIRANTAKTTFLANMSHEIRTPINSIIGLDEMIIRECHEGHIREYATSIRQASQSLLYLVNDILDITRIESQKMELVPVEYHLGEMLCGLMEMLSLRASSKNLELKTNISSHLPSVLYGDEVRLRQILTNLITNAIKYTQEGSVTLIINGIQEENSVRLHFAVKDTGIGIKTEDINKLGLAFERIDMTHNRNIEGSGLGLSITKQLLHLMGSRLNVTSEYGKGSVFSFDLTQKVIDAAPMKLSKPSVKKDSSAFIAPNAKILVVDDNAMNRRVFTGLLKKTKIQITEAESGKQCLELVKNSHYDIIFLDHMMPEMSGVEVFMEMQKWKEYPCKDTPKIMLTANALVESKKEYERLGFDGFLAKPIIIKDLENMIQNFLPDELVVVPDASAEQSISDNTNSERIDNLPVIHGVFWDAAKRHFTSAGLLINTISDFQQSIDKHCELIEQICQSAQAEEDISIYSDRIDQIHNTAGSIGAMPLAGICNSFLHALNTRQYKQVLAMAPSILEQLHEMKEQLAVVIEYYKKQL
jgi:signal transduction histidine kinase/CheY-like chemotaxis protein